MTRRNDPCPCGSGRRYKQCCGRMAGAPGTASPETAAAGITASSAPTPATEFQRLDEPPARGPGEPAARRLADTPGDLLVVEDFLTAAECRRLVEIGRIQPSEEGRIAVLDEDRETGDTKLKYSSHRITTLIKTFEVGDDFIPVVGLACQHWLRPAYGREIEWFEWPDILQYGPGGRYDLHADAEVRDPDIVGGWRRVQERDYSLLIYLNDEFTGGEIEFPNYDFRLRPKRGMLVAFPSDHRYLHAALPVESGIRFVIVSWAAAVGSPRLGQGARSGVIYTDPKYAPAELRGG